MRFGCRACIRGHESSELSSARLLRGGVPLDSLTIIRHVVNRLVTLMERAQLYAGVAVRLDPQSSRWNGLLFNVATRLSLLYVKLGDLSSAIRCLQPLAQSCLRAGEGKALKCLFVLYIFVMHK